MHVHFSDDRKWAHVEDAQPSGCWVSVDTFTVAQAMALELDTPFARGLYVEFRANGEAYYRKALPFRFWSIPCREHIVEEVADTEVLVRDLRIAARLEVL